VRWWIHLQLWIMRHRNLRLDLLRNRIHEYAVHLMDLRIDGGSAFADPLFAAGCRSIAREQRQNEVVPTPGDLLVLATSSLGLYKCHPLDSLVPTDRRSSYRAACQSAELRPAPPECLVVHASLAGCAAKPFWRSADWLELNIYSVVSRMVLVVHRLKTNE